MRATCRPQGEGVLLRRSSSGTRPFRGDRRSSWHREVFPRQIPELSYQKAHASAVHNPPASFALQDDGYKEIEFTGGFAHTSGSNVGTANGDVFLGYCVAPRVNLGLRQTLNYSFVDERSDTWTTSTIPFVNYNFETKKPNFRPFIGAFVGVAYNTDDTTGTGRVPLGA